MNQTSKKWDNNSITIEEQFHDWYHEGLTSQDVALRTSEMYEDYSEWKTAKQLSLIHISEPTRPY